MDDVFLLVNLTIFAFFNWNETASFHNALRIFVIITLYQCVKHLELQNIARDHDINDLTKCHNIRLFILSKLSLHDIFFL